MKNAFKLGQRKKNRGFFIVGKDFENVEVEEMKKKPLKKPLSRNGSSTQKDISYALYKVDLSLPSVNQSLT